MSERRIRVVLADGDRGTRSGTAFVLRRAGCSVRACPGAMTLARAIDDHRRGCPGQGISVLVIDRDLPQGGGIGGLVALGVFDLGVPVIVTAPEPGPELERDALSAGATLVVRVGAHSTTRAVRHVSEREKRWGGAWVSTGLLSRVPRATDVT